MSKNYTVLGLNFGGHDTSACLMVNGKLLVACEEERYTKQKHTRDFPKNAINDCLKQVNLSIENIHEITLSYDPELLKFANFENVNTGKKQVVSADLLVGADGSLSAVREQMVKQYKHEYV